jgi:hypothetical protein
VDRDYQQALSLERKAADAVSAEGMRGVGYMYANGFGVVRVSDTPSLGIARRLRSETKGEGKPQALRREPLVTFHLGHSHPNVPAVSKPYTSPSITSLMVMPHGWPFQMPFAKFPKP